MAKKSFCTELLQSVIYWKDNKDKFLLMEKNWTDDWTELTVVKKAFIVVKVKKPQAPPARGHWNCNVNIFMGWKNRVLKHMELLCGEFVVEEDIGSFP